MLTLKECSTIPIIEKVDLLIVGGGLAGLAVAKEYAAAGNKVMLIDKGTFLGYEMGQWQRPWFQMREAYFDIMTEWFSLSGLETKINTIVPINMDKFKINFEDILMNEGVKILYASIPVACTKQEEYWDVVIANKSGRQLIRTSKVIDVTPSSIIARLIENEKCELYPVDSAFVFHTLENKEVVSRTIEFIGIDGEFSDEYGMTKRWYEVPEHFGVWRDKVKIYQGGFSNDHVYVNIPVLVDEHDCSLIQDTQIEFKVRKISLEVAAWLGHHVHPFLLAKIGLGSLEVMPAVDFDPLKLLDEGKRLGKKLIGGQIGNDSCIIVGCKKNMDNAMNYCCKKSEDSERVTYSEHTEFNKLHKFSEVQANIHSLPVLGESDVLVVGGGTSGAVSARVAASEGVNTILLEMNTALGGTGTLGGVHFYWFGNRDGFTAEIDKRVNDLSDKLLYPKQKYYWGMNDSWSIEIKAFVLLEMCLEQSVTVFFNCFIMATLLEGKNAIGVAVATPYGPVALKSKVIVDATGDGDVAAFAGAEFIFGNERDPMTLWSSFAQFKKPGEYKGGNFSTTMDIGDVFDYTRFIIVARRRGGQELHDHSTYVTPRESRHIRGEVILNLMDQMSMRKYPDTISFCFSNHDPKGKSSSDIVYFGLLPANLVIEVPYRAMLPLGLEQLLVTGRALSCTHDAFSAIRMQDSMQQQGGAIGLAAALCVKDGISPRNLDVKKLQKKLVQMQMLPDSVLQYAEDFGKPDYSLIVSSLTGEEPFEWLEMSIYEKALTVSPLVQICAADKSQVLPLLRNRFQEASKDLKLLIARLLIWHKDIMGLDTVIDEIMNKLKESNTVPFRQGSVRWTHNYPDHGVMSEVSYLINALSRVPSKKTIAVLAYLTDIICNTKRDYTDRYQCIFNYIESVSYCSERLAYKELIPVLEKLLELPELQERERYDDVELDIMGERLSYLVISLARALARCGGKKGYLKLVGFVKDNRILLAKSARNELVLLTACDYGTDLAKWFDFIKAMPDEMEPIAWELNMD